MLWTFVDVYTMAAPIGSLLEPSLKPEPRGGPASWSHPPRGCMNARQPLPSRLVPAGFQYPSLGRALDGQYQRGMDGAKPVHRPRSFDGTRLFRLHPDRGFDLCRTELEEFTRHLYEERHVRSAQ